MLTSSDISGDPGVLIVGGGAGSLHTVQSLRENGHAGQVTVISVEKYAPTDRTMLSKGLVTGPAGLRRRLED